MDHKSTGRQLAGWGAMIWLAVVVSGYYVFHKPFNPEFALALLQLAWKLLVCTALLSICGGLGRRMLPDPGWHPLTALSLQAGLGLGLAGLAVLGVGSLGLLYPATALIAFLVGIFLLRRSILSWWRSWEALAVVWHASSSFGRLAAGMVGVISACGLLVALAPPLQFDALVYHLALPQHFLAAHRIDYLPGNVFWGMPQIPEMLTTWAASLAGFSAGPLLGWAAGLLALLGLLGLMSEHLGEEPALVGTAALVCGGTLASAMGWGYNDWWAVLFGLGCFAYLLLWRDSDREAHLAMAGIFAGFALGSKYTAGVLLACAALVIFIRRRSGLSQVLSGFLWFGLPALIVFSPWLVKNGLATGNPIYPLLFPGGAMTPLRLALYHGGRPWGNWMDLLFLPLRATIWGVEGAPGYSASIGPLLFGLVLAGGLGWSSRSTRERAAISLAAVFSLAGLLVWGFAGRFSSYLLQSRLYFAFFPALAFLAAAGFSGIAKIRTAGIRFRIVSAALILLVLGFTTIETSLQGLKSGAAQQVLALFSPQEYQDKNLGWFAPAMRAAGGMPAEARWIMLWEPRSLYCLPVCEPDEFLDRWLQERYGDQMGEPAAPKEILQSWRQSGYTHLLLYQMGADFIRRENPTHYQPDDWEALNELLGMLEPPEDFGGAYQLYRLIP